jgi:hypothetical protein
MLNEFRLELKKSSISQLPKLLVQPIHDLIRPAASGFCRVLRNLAGVNKQGFDHSNPFSMDVSEEYDKNSTAQLWQVLDLTAWL